MTLVHDEYNLHSIRQSRRSIQNKQTKVHNINLVFLSKLKHNYVIGTQKNLLNETVLLSTQKLMLKLMGKKITIFYAQKFCLSKPMLDNFCDNLVSILTLFPPVTKNCMLGVLLLIQDVIFKKINFKCGTIYRDINL